MPRGYDRISPVERGTLLAVMASRLRADEYKVPSDVAEQGPAKPTPAAIGELALLDGELQEVEVTTLDPEE